MTSSTSNSKPIEPRWGLIWSVTIVLVLLITGTWEYLARAAGLGPALVDNKTLWADTRHRLNKHGSDAIVLLGGSRMHRAVDVRTMSSHFERPVFQLAVEGSSYLPVLEDLAVDPRISGTIIISITPALTFNRELTQLDNGRQASYVEYQRSQSFTHRLEQSLTLFLQRHLAIRSPLAQPVKVVAEWQDSGAWPVPHYQTIFRDRVVHIDLDRNPADQDDDILAVVYDQHAAPYSTAEFAPFVDYTATLVDMLNRKGAEVIFVRLPSAGAIRTLERRLFPQQDFWDVLASNVKATFVHFDEHPQLDGFVSRDGSHTDSSKIVEFTTRLSNVLSTHTKP